MKIKFCNWFLACLAGTAFAADSPIVGSYRGEDVVLTKGEPL